MPDLVEAPEHDWSREVDTFLASLGRADRAGALGQVQQLRGEGHEVLTVIGNLLAPAQLRIGELWLRGDWTVAREHAATAVSESVLAALAEERERQAGRAPAPPGPPVVVACAEQEWHALPALMLGEHLRSAGFAVSFLGPNASVGRVVQQVHELAPAAVLLSCSLATYLPLVRREIEAVRETGTPIVVGGSAFDAAGRRAATLGATASAPTAAGIADLVRSLPRSVAPAPVLSHPGAAEAFTVFREREVLAWEVERRLHAALGAAGSETSWDSRDHEWVRVLHEQLPHLVGSVAGALVADDPAIATESLAWAEVVLTHRDAPLSSADALRRALRQVLHGMPVATRMLTDPGGS